MSTLYKKEGNNGRESTDIESGKERATKVAQQKPIQYPEENNKEGMISGLRHAKLKPKGRKWKFQARNLLSRIDRIGNPPGTKRLRNEEDELSPGKKRLKGMSPNYLLTNNTQTYSPTAKLKVCCE